MFCRNCGGQLERLCTFCVFCGSATDLPFEEEAEDDLIRHYFNKGFTYEEIRLFFQTKHDITFSLQTLKKRL